MQKKLINFSLNLDKPEDKKIYDRLMDCPSGTRSIIIKSGLKYILFDDELDYGKLGFFIPRKNTANTETEQHTTVPMVKDAPSFEPDSKQKDSSCHDQSKNQIPVPCEQLEPSRNAREDADAPDDSQQCIDGLVNMIL